MTMKYAGLLAALALAAGCDSPPDTHLHTDPLPTAEVQDWSSAERFEDPASGERYLRGPHGWMLEINSWIGEEDARRLAADPELQEQVLTDDPWWQCWRLDETALVPVVCEDAFFASLGAETMYAQFPEMNNPDVYLDAEALGIGGDRGVCWDDSDCPDDTCTWNPTRCAFAGSYLLKWSWCPWAGVLPCFKWSNCGC
jgi:hypothetical protein